jgi:hypothetical protein
MTMGAARRERRFTEFRALNQGDANALAGRKR